jgi:hypothetical protein
MIEGGGDDLNVESTGAVALCLFREYGFIPS